MRYRLWTAVFLCFGPFMKRVTVCHFGRGDAFMSLGRTSAMNKSSLCARPERIFCSAH